MSKATLLKPVRPQNEDTHTYSIYILQTGVIICLYSTGAFCKPFICFAFCHNITQLQTVF